MHFVSSESPFGWLCMTSRSLSPLIPSNISLACHDSSPVFRLSLWRFKLSQEVSLIPSLPLFSVFLAIFHCIFRLLASLSQDGHLLPFSPTLTFLLTIPRFANHLLILFMSYALASSLISTKWFWTQWPLFVIHIFEEAPFFFHLPHLTSLGGCRIWDKPNT